METRRSGENENSEYFRKLREAQPLYGELVPQISEFLSFPKTSSGLDAGCGIGTHTFNLADLISPGGEVTGFDINPDFVEYAAYQSEINGYRDRVNFVRGDIFDMPFEKNSFDWSWSADCAAYMPMNRQKAVNELCRVVKPGGTVMILANSSHLFLPGYPQLEARLNRSKTGIAPFTEGESPDNHFLRSLGLLDNAGLNNCSVRSFLLNYSAPLDAKLKAAIKAMIDMRWNPESVLKNGELDTFKALTNPESENYLLDKKNYHGFFVYTLFYGTKS